jgi:hypothetical protein
LPPLAPAAGAQDSTSAIRTGGSAASVSTTGMPGRRGLHVGDVERQRLSRRRGTGDGISRRDTPPTARKGRAVVEITEGQGLDAAIERLVLDALDREPTIGAVCSIGGSDVATIRALKRRGRHTGCSSPAISTTIIGCWCTPARSRPCYIMSQSRPGRPDHSGARWMS